MHTKMVAVINGAFFGLVALGIVYGVSLELSEYRLHQAYAALQADGRPLQLAQIIPPAIPDTNNAAPVCQAVKRKLKAERVGEKNQKAFTRMSNLYDEMLKTNALPQAQAAFRQLLLRKPVAEALQELDEGSARSGCRFISDYSKGPFSLYPPANLLMGLTKIMCAAARVQMADGDPAAAWQSELTALRLANALHDEPVQLSQAMRHQQFDLAAETISNLCNNARPSREQVAQLDVLLKTFEDQTPLVRVVDGERLLAGEWYFNTAYSKAWRAAKGVRRVKMLIFLTLRASCAPFRFFDLAVYLNFMHAAALQAGLPYSAMDLVWEKTMARQSPWYCLSARAGIAGFSSAKKQTIDMIARARILRAGLAVLLWRQEQGIYPENLAAVHMENLADPFSGKALLYRAQTNGFLIYSVGPNMRDDGGEATTHHEKDDVAWRYVESVTR